MPPNLAYLNAGILAIFKTIGMIFWFPAILVDKALKKLGVKPAELSHWSRDLINLLQQFISDCSVNAFIRWDKQLESSFATDRNLELEEYRRHLPAAREFVRKRVAEGVEDIPFIDIADGELCMAPYNEQASALRAWLETFQYYKQKSVGKVIVNTHALEQMVAAAVGIEGAILCEYGVEEKPFLGFKYKYLIGGEILPEFYFPEILVLQIKINEICQKYIHGNLSQIASPGRIVPKPMEPEQERAPELRAYQAKPSGSQNRFQQQGDYWEVEFEGKQFRLKDQKGLSYIKHLLRNQGKRINVLELVRAVEPQSPEVPIERDRPDEIIDSAAKKAYALRLKEISGERAQAERQNDTATIKKLDDEVEFIKRELSGARGLNGKKRTFSSNTELARTKIKKQIDSARDKISEANSKLGSHLQSAIKTGIECSYIPEQEIQWEL